jgi:Sulfotransferase domain
VTAGTAPAVARRAARSTWRAAGTLTSPARMLPSFLIVGAQRCGTTSLFKALIQHPAVRRPFGRKGIHYFDVGYHHGLGWYRSHFPLSLPGSRTITGESSPYYMFHPLAPQRIARDLPGVRLIVALRDPVERAYSAHAHEFARGFETEPFERALELEAERLAGEERRLRGDDHAQSHSYQHQAYLTRGHYIDQLQQLDMLIGRDSIHVVDSASFFADPAPTFGALISFLGLAPAAAIRFEQHNARHRADMPSALRARLDEHFAPYDERLADWLGHAPSWRQ